MLKKCPNTSSEPNFDMQQTTEPEGSEMVADEEWVVGGDTSGAFFYIMHTIQFTDWNLQRSNARCSYLSIIKYSFQPVLVCWYYFSGGKTQISGKIHRNHTYIQEI